MKGKTTKAERKIYCVLIHNYPSLYVIYFDDPIFFEVYCMKLTFCLNSRENKIKSGTGGSDEEKIARTGILIYQRHVLMKEIEQKSNKLSSF